MAQRTAGILCLNHELQHITVLEEAHNLLRRTSTVQSQESSNLQGKSVELLTNMIAEMRTYGEGFIIADQAPALLDMAAIRNTNTKIILRLPDEEDRKLVGKAAGLNDDQIVELSRLDTGVAAVYQNHWLEPVLCKVEFFNKERAYVMQPIEQELEDWVYRLLLDGVQDGIPLAEEKVDRIRVWIDRQEIGAEAKRLLTNCLLGNQLLSEQERGWVLYCLAHGRGMLEQIRRNAVLPTE